MRPMTPTIPSQPAPAPAPTPPVPDAPGAGSAVPIAASIRPSAHRRKSSDATSIRSAFSPPRRSAGLALSKSTAALPVATQIQVGSTAMMHNAAAPTANYAAAIATHVHMNSGGLGAYRPRGPPMDQEMDPESDSDRGGIMFSQSVAQEKLRALVQRTSAARNPDPNAAGPSGARHLPPPPVTDDNDVPQWAMVSPHPPQNPPPAAPARRVPAGLQLTRMEPQQRPPATAPIQVGYPYNLPPPPPPSTPRTTRRNMLATEMSESLRRNLLWQRQTSKPNPAALRRTTSAGATRYNPLGGEQAVLPSMVQLHPKGTRPEGLSQITQKPAPATQEERDEARQRRISRNKSYADDYHYTGW